MLQNFRTSIIDWGEKKCCVAIKPSSHFKMVMNAAFKRSINVYRHVVSIVLGLRLEQHPHYTNYKSLPVKNHHLSGLQSMSYFNIMLFSSMNNLKRWSSNCSDYLTSPDFDSRDAPIQLFQFRYFWALGIGEY